MDKTIEEIIEKIMDGWESPPTFEQVEESLKEVATKATELERERMLKEIKKFEKEKDACPVCLKQIKQLITKQQPMKFVMSLALTPHL